ncbi:NADPH-dependent FMN reductase [Streptomyces celluloflavus]|uniref:NADPH-dependent FMN reductase n=1 Tax=Streptomyces celluloflavus TaxID=58344 RepID=A0ABW7RNG0_9ACTN
MTRKNPTVVVVCGSRKPAPGIDRPSAARELLKPVLAGISDTGATTVQFDLRKMDIPLFDGRTAEEYDSPDVDRLTAALSNCTAVVFSVPAYWNAPSGPVINLLNVLGGASYDRTPDLPPPYQGKRAAQLVVGADPASGYLAAATFRGSLSALGFRVSPHEVVVGNPRSVGNIRVLTAQLRALGAHAGSGARDPEEPHSGVVVAEGTGA